MASDLKAMASNLKAMASNLKAMAFNPKAMATNPKAMASNPKSDGLQPKSDGLQPKSDGLQIADSQVLCWESVDAPFLLGACRRIAGFYRAKLVAECMVFVQLWLFVHSSPVRIAARAHETAADQNGQ